MREDLHDDHPRNRSLESRDDEKSSRPVWEEGNGKGLKLSTSPVPYFIEEGVPDLSCVAGESASTGPGLSHPKLTRF
jgi:hypothetical protein